MGDAGEIETQFEAAGIDPLNSPSACRQLRAYLDLLLRWNARMNLTSVRTPQGIIRRHFVECVFAARRFPPGISTLLDFGSGAGFPGILIAICRPEIHVVLAEARGNKAVFLKEALRVLGIPGEVYRGRVEGMPMESTFDAVTLRAVDKMADAISAAHPRAKRLLALFTGEGGEEYEKLAPEFLWRKPVSLPPSKRTLLLLGERR